MAEAAIDESFCRRYAQAGASTRRQLLQGLLTTAVDAVAQVSELTLTRYVLIDGTVHWEHVSDTLTLDLSLKAARLDYHILLLTPEGRACSCTHTWFDPATMPCYLTSLAERAFEDVYALCHHAAALSVREETSATLLPYGTRGPCGEPADRIDESRLLVAHPYLLLPEDPVPTIDDIPWEETDDV